MIGRLKGIILEKQPPFVLIETNNGIGYEVKMPTICFYELPAINREAVVFTHFLVREDAQLLFGFNSKPARALFRELIKVNGVGPKLALVILSGMSAQQFVTTVEHEEISALVKLPGVGKKTADRLVVEMKNRFEDMNGDLFASDASFPITSKSPNPAAINGAKSEAVAALVALGYKLPEASQMISKLGKQDADCEVLIREALRAAI